MRALADLTTGAAPAALAPGREANFAAAAERLSVDHNLAAESAEYEQQFLAAAPTMRPTMLHVDDYSAISHIGGVAGLAGYASRAFTRAHEGDIVAGTFAVIEGYDNYLAARLGLGRPQYLRVAPADGVPPYAVFTALLSDEASQHQLLEIMRDRGSLMIHPYMGTRDAWRVAKMLTAQGGRAVKVLAPLPAVARLANNKTDFLRLVREVLGDEAAIQSTAAASLTELVTAVRRYSAAVPTVALKLSDSASGMGTRLLRSADLKRLAEAELRASLLGWTEDKEWQEEASPPIDVEQWEESVLASPSIQTWIPPWQSGRPIVEGIFDQQFVTGREEKVFEGSVPSSLPRAIQAQLAEEGAALARTLQLAGYVGRCSFDTILVGDSIEQGVIKFVECNGRWGGTSIPMMLMNRLFGDWRQQPYTASDLMHEKLCGLSVTKLVETLDDVMLDRRSGQGWAVVYNVGPLFSDGKLDVLTIGATQAEATARQAEFRDLIEKRF